MLGAFPSLSMWSTEGSRCCVLSTWQPSDLPPVAGVPRVLDHLPYPEARGFRRRRTRHSSLNLILVNWVQVSDFTVIPGFDIDLNSPRCEFEVWRPSGSSMPKMNQFSPNQWLLQSQCVPPVQNLGPNLLPESTQCEPSSMFWVECNQLLSVIDYQHS